MFRQTWWRHLWDWRSFLLSVSIPLLLLPIPLAIQTQWSRCAYVLVLMASFWLLELIPLAVTALLPVFLFPLLGVLNTEAVCKQYMQDTLMIFLGSLIAAAAVEHCNLHQRIALKVLSAVGAQPKWLLLGFMFTTTVLSMWMSNAAATALMVPIVEAVLVQLAAPDESSNAQSSDTAIELPEVTKTAESTTDLHDVTLQRNQSSDCVLENSLSEKTGQSNVLHTALYLGICYGSNIGGTGTLTGTIPNFILVKEIESTEPDYEGLTFANWLLFNTPTCLVCMILAWLFLLIVYIRKCPRNKDLEDAVENDIKQRYLNLGPMTFHEAAVLFLFTLMVLLFFFRSPQFIKGWGDFFEKDIMKDAAVAIFVTTLMFIIPAKPGRIRESQPLLQWSVVHEKVSWGIVLLLGGGFALAEGSKVSGLSNEIAQQLLHVTVESRVGLQLIVCILTLVLTEITSNAATATILLPVIGRMVCSTSIQFTEAVLALFIFPIAFLNKTQQFWLRAKKLNLHPLLLMMPVCISSSYAFMLPMASGPTAIAYNAAKFNSAQLAVPGFFVKIICLFIIILATNTIGVPIFGLEDLSYSSSLTGSNATTITSTLVT